MAANAIDIQNISKLYKISSLKRSLSEDIRYKFSNLFQKNNFSNHQEDFWALKDISFEVRQGDAVGIIGKNGAGKSTLLKILSKITAPSKGRIEIDGRVSSLLEVGTGFHPELTGRENIFLNAAILGMQRSEIKQKFEAIVDFSGIERFIDTPVKRYSSGMYVRLAFAVAAFVEPEVLIIDEVLAVGDYEFQKKCLGKMEHAIGEGRTVLFVSHNMQAISSLTNKCVFLEKGKVKLIGSTNEVVSAYIKGENGNLSACLYKNQEKTSGNYIEEVKVITSENSGIHHWGDEIVFEFVFHLENKSSETGFSFQVMNNENRAICHFSPPLVSLEKAKDLGDYKFTYKCRVPKFRLFMGSYSLTTWLADNRSKTLIENLENICPFEVSMVKKRRENYDWKETDCVYIDDYFFE